VYIDISMTYLPGVLEDDSDDIPAASVRSNTDNVLWFQHPVSLKSDIAENNLL